MAAIVYPTELPGPGDCALTPDERRRVPSIDGGPFDTADGQTDFLATQTHTFVLTDAEFDAWWTWWKNTLIFGGAWFAAAWPHPAGAVTAARQFITAPTVEALGNGRRRITIQSQLRGAGVMPTNGA